jgi:prevent-host-death family protein
MPDALFNLYEAKAALSKLVERAAAGEEIIIAKNGRPMAKLTAAAGRGTRRQPGGWKGKVVISADFDAPLPGPLRKGFGGKR